ncbi:unnamed protein product [Caenorhabditis sp. 36 PRJEB53466]|nr:unnamed protein product [Caenorhabditis sp. 36 PRJEB53466]
MGFDKIVESETDFGLRLLGTFPKKDDESLVFSPLSISLGLALVHSGARGHARKELELAVLGLDGTQNDRFAEHFAKVVGEVTNAKNGVETSIANRVFVNQEHAINQSYLNEIQKTYQAGAESLDFSQSEEAAKVINKFVAAQTSGKITKLITSDTVHDAFALLVNAVHFNADWLDKFEKHSTFELAFHKKEGESREICFLNENEIHRDYTENDTWQVLALPYVDQDFKFVIFLPKEQFGLQKALEKLTGWSFQMLLVDLKNSYVNVRIPRMHIETEVSLRESLDALGVRDIFSDSGDVSAIADGLRISSGIHKSVIDVDEDGTTAAASSAFKPTLDMMILANPIDFIADHPFLFAVLHKNRPLFMGTHY